MFVWRADARRAIWKDTRVVGLEGRQLIRCYDIGSSPTSAIESKLCPWTQDSFHELVNSVTEDVPEGDERDRVVRRFEQTLDPNKEIVTEKDMEGNWDTHRKASPQELTYESSLAKIWKNAGCTADNPSAISWAPWWTKERVDIRKPDLESRSRPYRIRSTSSSF